MKNTSKISLFIAIFVLGFGLISSTFPQIAHAATPTLAFAQSGTNTVQISVNGDQNQVVNLYYYQIGSTISNSVGSIGTTNSSGYFSNTLNTTAYNIPAGASVYVVVNGQQSQTATWPSTTGGSIYLSQSSIVMNQGQTTSISMSGGSGTNYYVNSNSNSGVVGTSISGSVLTLNALTSGYVTINICSLGTNTTCAPLAVTVNSSWGGNNSGSIYLSPSSVTVAPGQTQTVYINNNSGNYNNQNYYGAQTYYISNNPGSVLEVLKKYMASGHVVIQSNAEVSGFIIDRESGSREDVTEKDIDVSLQNRISVEPTITGVRIKGNDTVFGKKFILATGGKSRPETGSTGDGFAWAKQLGHTVVEPSASLVPLKVKEVWIKNLAGITLREVKITILQNRARQNKPVKGKILFTHVGVSGPTVLNLSKDIGELLKYGDVFISVDVLPQIDQASLDTKLNTLFRTEINKKLKNCLGLIGGVQEADNSPVLPTALIKTVIEISGVDGETPAHSVTKEDRRKILATLKGLTMQISGLLGTDKAIVTSGGVVLTEIEPKTMQSRIHPNLYLVGDMLNIDRPSGGYSLQLCWTTGYVAGSDIGNSVRNVKQD